MATKYEKKLIAKGILQRKIDDLLGKKTEFEITLKAIESVFDYANGIRQAANINNNQLSAKAQNGLAYMQNIDSIIQTIKSYKQETDAEIDAIDLSQEDPVPNEQPLPPKEESETEV